MSWQPFNPWQAEIAGHPTVITVYLKIKRNLPYRGATMQQVLGEHQSPLPWLNLSWLHNFEELSVSTKAGWTPSQWHSISTPEHLPNRNESLCSPPEVQTNFQSNCIHNNLKQRIPQCPSRGKQINKLWSIYTTI